MAMRTIPTTNPMALENSPAASTPATNSAPAAARMNLCPRYRVHRPATIARLKISRSAVAAGRPRVELPRPPAGPAGRRSSTGRAAGDTRHRQRLHDRHQRDDGRDRHRKPQAPAHLQVRSDCRPDEGVMRRNFHMTSAYKRSSAAIGCCRTDIHSSGTAEFVTAIATMATSTRSSRSLGSWPVRSPVRCRTASVAPANRSIASFGRTRGRSRC